jgi:hypothetical protein
MSEPTADDAAGEQSTFPSPGKAAATRHSAPASPGVTKVIPVVALVFSVAALGLAGWAALRPAATASPSAAGTASTSSEPSPTFDATQRDAAKAKTCATLDAVRKGVTLNTNQSPPGGAADVTGSLAVAANARLSLFNGGQYLLARIDPATPDDLANEVRRFADTLMDIGAASTGGARTSDPDQTARLQDADATSRSLAGLCAS